MYGKFVLVNQIATDQFLKLLKCLFIHKYMTVFYEINPLYSD